jgi:hypothetical protein
MCSLRVGLMQRVQSLRSFFYQFISKGRMVATTHAQATLLFRIRRRLAAIVFRR